MQILTEHSGANTCSVDKYSHLHDFASQNAAINCNRRSLFTGLDYWTGLLDWTSGLIFDRKCSIYMKKFMFYLCEKNYIDRAHGFFAQSTV